MAESKTKVANSALGKVGARFISSFNELSDEARIVNEVYNDILDEVLSEHLWTFAQKRAVLAVITGTPVMTEDGVTIIYAKPSDFIKLNFTNDPFSLVKVEGNEILSDTEDLKIIYTFRNEDPIKYFAKFTQALIYRLAAEICFALTESVKKTADLQNYYDNEALPSAVSVDSQQGTPVAPMQDEWLNSRIFGAGRFATTGDTWHPW